MRYPKIGIQKKVEFNNGKFRFYPANYDPKQGKFKRGKMPKMPIIDLYLYPSIKTEKQLIKLLYDKWREGEYLLLGYVKGRRGTWVFWKGIVTKRGYIFNQRMPKSVEKSIWDKDIFQAETEEEKQELLKYKAEEIEEERNRIKQQKYGFMPYLKPSGRRGQLVLWEDIDLPAPEDREETNWNPENIKKETQKWDMTKAEEKNIEEW